MMKHARLALTLAAALTGCAGVTAAPGTDSAAVSVTEPSVNRITTADTAAEITTAAEMGSETAAASDNRLTLDDAKQIFSDTHPDIPVEVAKLEGDAYYIEGREGSRIYKMKISTETGAVYLDKTITTGPR